MCNFHFHFIHPFITEENNMAINLSISVDQAKALKKFDDAFYAIRAAYPGDSCDPLTMEVYSQYLDVWRYNVLQFCKDCTFGGVNLFDLEREDTIPWRTPAEESKEIDSIADELERLFAPDLQRLKQLWVHLVTMNRFKDEDPRAQCLVEEIEQRILYDFLPYKNTTRWVASSTNDEYDERIVRAEAIKRAKEADDNIGCCIQRRVRGTNHDLLCIAYNERSKKEVVKQLVAPGSDRHAIEHALIVLSRLEVK